jgi:hypothetical protein
MSSVRKSQPASKNPNPPLAQPLVPMFVPWRKYPVRLVLLAIVLAAWLTFLAVMAFRG